MANKFLLPFLLAITNLLLIKQSHAVITQVKTFRSPSDTGHTGEDEMKFHDLPKDAQHHALSTLRELIISGNRGEDEQALAGKVQAAFVSMYSDAGATTHTGTINVNFSNVPAGVSCIEKVAQAVTLRPSDGVSRVYHDTIVKCLKIEIEKLRSQIAVNEIVAY